MVYFFLRYVDKNLRNDVNNIRTNGSFCKVTKKLMFFEILRFCFGCVRFKESPERSWNLTFLVMEFEVPKKEYEPRMMPVNFTSQSITFEASDRSRSR